MTSRTVQSIALLIVSAIWPLSGQTPSKEYIYLGGRVIATEAAPSSAPTVVSLNPTTGSGSAQSFVSVYQDANGANDIQTTEIRIVPSGGGVSSGCVVRYQSASAVLQLLNDAGTAAVGQLAPGQATTLSNTRCTLAGSTSSVSANANQLAVTYGLSFAAAFEGSKDVQLAATDASGGTVGPVTQGAWVIPDTTPPSVVNAITVSQITTSSAMLSWTANEDTVFQVEYGTTTAYGWVTPAQFGTTYAAGHSIPLTGLAANTTYHFRIRLRDTSSNESVTGDANFATTAPAGGPTISNISVVDITTASARVTWSTNVGATSQVEYGITTGFGTLVPLPASSAYVTSHNILLSGLTQGQTYYYRVRSKNSQGIETISATQQFSAKCISVSPASAQVYASLALGISAALNNCDGSDVTWALTGAGFLTPFQTPPLTAGYVAPSGISTQQTATARATAANLSYADSVITILPNDPPTILGGYPVSGVGARQLFTTHVGDLQGASNIAAVQVVLKSDWTKTCQYYLNTQWNLLGLYLDDGSSVSQPIGSTQVLQNSQCTIYPATSYVNTNGQLLSLTVDVQFKPVFSGMKEILVAVNDFQDNLTGYQAIGTWLVPGVAGTSHSDLVSISAPTQVAPGQSFQATVVMRNTGQNIWQAASLNPTQPHRLGSISPNDNTTWGLSRVNSATTQVLPNENATFVINATAPTSTGSKSFAWKMVHDAVEWFGATASTTIIVTNTPYPESQHPYNDNQDQTWSHTYSGSCASLNVSFDSRTKLQSGDYIYVMDGNYTGISGSPYSLTSLAGQTVSVPGSTVRVRLTSNSSGTDWGFLISNVSCVPAAPGAGTYDNFHSAINYSWGWIHDTQFWQPSNGTISYSDSASASAEFTFYGTSISYFFTRAWNRGIANIYIDNQSKGTVDLYSPNVEWQQGAWFGGLSPGNHTIRIEVSGSKHPASQGTYVDLDGFIVW